MTVSPTASGAGAAGGVLWVHAGSGRRARDGGGVEAVGEPGDSRVSSQLQYGLSTGVAAVREPDEELAEKRVPLVNLRPGWLRAVLLEMGYSGSALRVLNPRALPIGWLVREQRGAERSRGRQETGERSRQETGAENRVRSAERSRVVPTPARRQCVL